MPANRNITAADITLALACEELFPQGVILEQFSTDAMIAQADETYTETRKGVDCQMVAGYVDGVKTITLTFEPSSPSVIVIDTLARAMRANKKVYWLTLVASIPSINKVLTYSNGVLKTGKLLPDAQQTLAAIPYTFDFESVK